MAQRDAVTDHFHACFTDMNGVSLMGDHCTILRSSITYHLNVLVHLTSRQLAPGMNALTVGLTIRCVSLERTMYVSYIQFHDLYPVLVAFQFSNGAVAMWLEHRTFNRENPGLELLFRILGNFVHTTLPQLTCIQQYLEIYSGGYVNEHSSRSNSSLAVCLPDESRWPCNEQVFQWIKCTTL